RDLNVTGVQTCALPIYYMCVDCVEIYCLWRQFRMNVKIQDLFDLSHTAAADYLRQFEYPWEALEGISQLILSLGSTLSPEEYDQPQPQVWVHRTAKVMPSAYLGAPCIIGPNTEVRHGAFVRGSAL